MRICALVIGCIGLAALYSVGVILPLSVSLSLTVVACIFHICFLRRDRRHLVSASTLFLVAYIYAYGILFFRIIDPAVYVSLWGLPFQTDAIFAAVAQVATSGVIAFLVCYSLAVRKVGSRSIVSMATFQQQVPISFWLALVLSVIFLMLAVPVETVLSVKYVDYGAEGGAIQTAGRSLDIYVIKPAMYISLLLALHAYIQNPSPAKAGSLITVATIGIVLAGFLAGGRVDEVSFCAAAGWLFWRKNGAKLRKGLVITGLLVLPMLQMWAFFRQSIVEMTSNNESFGQAASRAVETIFSWRTGNTLRYSQAGGIASTSCALFGLIESGSMTHDYGRVFVNYVSQTLPRSINPERPPELQLQLLQLRLTNGGLFVINEPYLAFGVSGVVLAMVVLGTIVGRLERAVWLVRFSSPITIVGTIVVFSVLRTAHYGLFTLYKNLLAAFIVFVACALGSRLLQRERAVRVSTAPAWLSQC